MDDRCNKCGGELTLEVLKDDEYYQRSVKLLKKPDARFKGEKYRFVCNACGKVGSWVHWDTYPDMLGYIEDKETAIKTARLLFEYCI